MYTRFSGENGQSPARWLRTLKYEFPPAFTPGQWLESVDGLLDGEAARWADKELLVKNILSEKGLKYADTHDVGIFKEFLLSRFHLDEVLEDADHLIMNLLQSPTESLVQYYGRAANLLYASGGRDVDRDDTYPFVTLTDRERSILNKVILHYVTGLHHSCLISNSALRCDSLHRVYLTTCREERRMLEMGEVEYVKMKNETTPQ